MTWTLLIVGIPRDLNFGIDYYSYHVNENFMGFKDIPTGLHYIYYQWKNYPCVSKFEGRHDEDIIVYEWDADKEEIIFPSLETVEEYSSRWKHGDFIKNVLPYPVTECQPWIGLSKHIDGKFLSDFEPIGKWIFPEKEKSVFFQHIPTLPKEIANAMNITDSVKIANFCRDRTEILDFLISTTCEKAILTEFSISFILFLIGQDFRGFEQWKKILHLVSNCENISVRKDFFEKFLQVFLSQLNVITIDFFADEQIETNFLSICLGNLVENLSNNGMETSQLKSLVESKFGIILGNLDEPVVVSETVEYF